MRIIISNRSTVPIYEQIKLQIIDAILSDELREDTQLPSIRQLAKELKVSVITTTRAYKDLEGEGYVVNVQGKGCYVLPKNQELVHEKLMGNMENLIFEALALKEKMNLDDTEFMEIIQTLMEAEKNE
ncbi:GntR family transcriptional regulator [Proteiniclasticum ruminis]|uniref:Transcriptional regulator, GntR family n=1 Tax=Proteiniclasticum ruminis TaxID=398199 RepID=A0A1I5B7E3_9CLOT|nr:GntR family transcriptional regulator [Proteiniclasticum ruminis]SFN70614.1 transcriptional regulator, GntR family [Proteiniclasticum ruminis]